MVFHALSVGHATGSLPSTMLPCGPDPRGPVMEAIKKLYAHEASPEDVLAAARNVGPGLAVRLKVGDYSEAPSASGSAAAGNRHAHCEAG